MLVTCVPGGDAPIASRGKACVENLCRSPAGLQGGLTGGQRGTDTLIVINSLFGGFFLRKRWHFLIL